MTKFDTIKFDSLPFDAEGDDVPAGAAGSVADVGLGPDADFVFAGFGFGNAPPVAGDQLLISQVSEDSGPNRNVVAQPNPNQDGQKVETDLFPNKIITFTGTIRAETSAELDLILDGFKRALATSEAELKTTKLGGVVRYYTATHTGFADMFSRRTGQDLTRAPFKLTFLCSDPFSRPETRTVVSRFNQTDTTITVEVDNDGSYKTNPIFFLDFDADDTISAVTLKNLTNGGELVITRSFSAGELLEVNGEDKVVEVNGSAVDFDGQFFEIEPGVNSITVEVTSTSHSYTLTLKYFERFL